MRPFDQSSFKPDKPTRNNDLVRSAKEVGIANLLRRLGLRYEYEKELILDGERFVPDFFLVDYGVYLEYYGLMNWKEYAKRTEYKLRRYTENKVRCIHLFRSSVVNMNRILRYEINKINVLKEDYTYKAELPIFIMILEKQPSFMKSRKFKWDPTLDKILLMNKSVDGNLDILAKVLHKNAEDLKKHIKSIEAKKRKKELENIRNAAREKLAKLSLKRT